MAKGERVVVVGAGMVGVSTAIWLQRAGGLKVTLVDREGPAAGASYGNAGILAAAAVAPVSVPGLIGKAPKLLFDPMEPLFLRWSYLPKIAPFLLRFLANGRADRVEAIAGALTTLLADSVDQHESLAAGTDAARFIRREPWLFGYEDRRAFEADAFGWGLKRRNGHAMEEMESDEVAAYDPALAGRFGFAAKALNQGFITDPGAYIRALWDHFVAEGGEVVAAEMRDIRLENGRAVALETSAGEIAADRIVVAAGAWSGPVAAKLGVRVPLETERGYHVEFLNPSVRLRSTVMVTAGKFGATPMEGRLRCAGVVELGGLKAPPSDAPFLLIEANVRKVFPDLTYEGTERWMGHRPSTTDSLPVIGPAPAAEGVWFGYGHQHVGLTGGPKTGRWLAQMITEAPPNEDLSRFSPARGAVISV